jgi:hypothetical protein
LRALRARERAVALTRAAPELALTRAAPELALTRAAPELALTRAAPELALARALAVSFSLSRETEWLRTDRGTSASTWRATMQQA